MLNFDLFIIIFICYIENNVFHISIDRITKFENRKYLTIKVKVCLKASMIWF